MEEDREETRQGPKIRQQSTRSRSEGCPYTTQHHSLWLATTATTTATLPNVFITFPFPRLGCRICPLFRTGLAHPSPYPVDRTTDLSVLSQAQSAQPLNVLAVRYATTVAHPVSVSALRSSQVCSTLFRLRNMCELSAV
jgi:hypothetical protein